METPVITLKQLKINERLSDDSLCFSCVVYVNGTRAFEVWDNGQGGVVEYNPLGKNGAKLLSLVEEYARGLPPLPSEFFPEGLEMDIDLLVDSLIRSKLKEERERKFADKIKRLCKVKTLFRLPTDEVLSYRTIEHVYDEQVKSHLNKKYPGVFIYNEQ